MFSCDEYLPETYDDLSKLSQKQLAGIERWQKFSEEANANGIDVVFLQRTEGVSSTQLKQTILEHSDYQKPNNEMIYSESEITDENYFCK